MRHGVRRRFGCIFIVTAVLTAGCSSTTPTPTQSPGVSPPITAGGTPLPAASSSPGLPSGLASPTVSASQQSTPSGLPPSLAPTASPSASGQAVTPSPSASQPSNSPTASPSPAARIIQIDFGFNAQGNRIDQMVAVREDGTVGEYGSGPVLPADLTDVTAVVVGNDSVLALKRDGTLVSWGSPLAIPPGLSGVQAIFALAGQGDTFLAVKRNGTAVAWGHDDCGNTKIPAGLTKVVSVSSSFDGQCGVVLALRSDGTVAAWGRADLCHVTPCPTLSSWARQWRGATTVAAGGFNNSLAVAQSNGKVTWQGDWGDGTAAVGRVKSIAFGFCSGLALRMNGTVTTWGQLSGCPADETAIPAGLSDVTQLWVDADNIAALKSAGTVVSWGSHSSSILNVVPPELRG